MGEHDHAREEGVVVGHVCVFECQTMLQFHLESGLELPGVDFHVFFVDLGQDEPGLLEGYLCLLFLGPVGDLEFLTHPPDLFNRNVDRNLHVCLLFCVIRF